MLISLILSNIPPLHGHLTSEVLFLFTEGNMFLNGFKQIRFRRADFCNSLITGNQIAYITGMCIIKDTTAISEALSK